MSNALIIRDFKKSITSDIVEVSADVDGDRVFFRIPRQFELDCRGEPFLGIALLEAMVRNVDIRIEDSMPISEKVYKMLPELQAVYASWNSNLSKVNIHARIEPCKDVYDPVACYWSGGVDSSHTLLRNMTEITHLIMLGGFEYKADNTPESWRQLVKKQTVFARNIGKELIPVETNAKRVTDQRKISWAMAQGLILASMGSLLKCKRIYIGSGNTYNHLIPWGTHPLTDPMWSTESTEIIHYGAGFGKGEKMIDLCKNQNILDNLQVCWRNPHRNCGECEKCVRTMTGLYLLEASSKTLPKLDNLNKLSIFRNSAGESGGETLEALLALAKNVQNKEVQRIMRNHLRRYHMLQIIVMVDRFFLGGRFRQIYYRVENPSMLSERVSRRGSQPLDI